MPDFAYIRVSFETIEIVSAWQFKHEESVARTAVQGTGSDPYACSIVQQKKRLFFEVHVVYGLIVDTNNSEGCHKLIQQHTHGC